MYTYKQIYIYVYICMYMNICVNICYHHDSGTMCSSILFEKTKCKCVPQMGRIYVTQNDNKTITKTITKLTRKPSSNTMAH